MSKRKGGQSNNKNAEKWTEEKTLELGIELIEWSKREDSLFISDFFIDRDLNSDTGLYLSKKYDSFSGLYARVRERLANKIAKNALYRDMDSSFAKFTLTVNHGWIDKKEVKQTNIEVPPLFPDGDEEL